MWEKWLPQSHRGQAPALNRQGGNVRVAASYNVEFILHSGIGLTSVALVARPCAPVALRAEDSSSSRSRLAKSYGRFAPLNLRQDCFFRVYLPKTTFLVQSACGGQSDFVHSYIHREATFRQLPKAADASQPLGFDKQSSLRRLPILKILMYNKLMAKGINKYKNGHDFYKDSETDQIWLVDNHGQEGPYLFSFDQKTVFNFWTDYPDKLTPEQIEIFKKENPTMAELK